VLEGFNGTIFAYGQTGSGKTFTIQGKGDSSELHGLMPRAFHHIFEFINGSKVPQFLVRVSYLEIYKEELRDLLSKDSSKRLEIRENPICGPYVMDLTKVLVKSVKEIEKVMITGNKYRSVGSTDMNELNLRSHTIFIITVERCVIDSNGRSHIRFGKLNLVDLADSQCLRESHSGNKEKRILDERVETAKLEARLQTIFPKLLGGCNAEKGIIALKNHMRIQDDALEQQKKCLSKQQEHENKMRQHIRAEADNVLALYEDFFALQKEVDV
ncbi:unnamed protein product, partial [Hymenolepis diminuta]